MNDQGQEKLAGESKGPGIGCFLVGIGIIVMVCLGYTFVPYARYGGDRLLEPWQMWGIGLVLILMSIGGVIRQMRVAGKALVLKTTLKDQKGDGNAEQHGGG